MWENIIIDCGDYGYKKDDGAYIIVEWASGWQETGESYDMNDFTDEQMREYCARRNHFNGDDLRTEIFGL